MIYTVTMIDSFKNEQNAKFSSPVSNTKGIYWMPDDSWIAGFFTDLAEAIRLTSLNIVTTTQSLKDTRKVCIQDQN